jgi:hypothetical protein
MSERKITIGMVIDGIEHMEVEGSREAAQLLRQYLPRTEYTLETPLDISTQESFSQSTEFYVVIANILSEENPSALPQLEVLVDILVIWYEQVKK